MISKDKQIDYVVAWIEALTIIIGPAFIVGFCPENKLILLGISVIVMLLSKGAECIEYKSNNSNVELVMFFVRSFCFIWSLYSLLGFFLLCGTIPMILFVVGFVVFSLIKL